MHVLNSWLAAMFVALALLLPSASNAQVALQTTTETAAETTLPDPLTPDAVNALVSRLSDTEVRSLLLAQLEREASGSDTIEAEANAFLDRLTVGAFSSIAAAVERLPVLWEKQIEAFANFSERARGMRGVLMFLGLTLVSIAAGVAAELAFGRLTRSWRVLPPRNEVVGLRETIRVLAQRFAGEFVGIVIFVLVARQVGKAIQPPEVFRLGEFLMPWLLGLPRVAWAFSRFMMAPNAPDYRIVHTDDATARGLCIHQTGFAFLIGLSVVLPQFNQMHGVPLGETRLGFWLNLSAHLYIVYVAVRYRSGLRLMMLGHGDEVTPTEARAARFYPTFAIIVALSTWWVVNVVASYGTPEAFQLLSRAPHYWTMLILLMAPALDTMIRGLVHHLAPQMEGEGPIAERAHLSAKRSYIRIGRVIVFVTELLIIARVWGMTPQSLASAGVGERVAADLIEFMMILSVGYFVYEVVSLWINRKLAREQTALGEMPGEEEVGGEGGGAGGSRLTTVLPLVLASSRVAILAIFTLLALGAIGIDTTPLLAGAGIVGLAIGFGAQKLVSDVVSGIFFLIDDAFRTGEYVEVDGTMGTVEKISIRSMQLRHHRGPVHTIPYGEIPKLTNYSRDWVIMKLKFTVPFDTDPNKVKKIFKKIGAEMMEDPLFSEDFLQPFKSQGVFEFDDVGMVIRGKFMSKPGTQFTIRKEVYNRVKRELEAAGIDFARREVRVAIPGLDQNKELGPEEQTALAAAATQAAQDAAQEQVAAVKPGD